MNSKLRTILLLEATFVLLIIVSLSQVQAGAIGGQYGQSNSQGCASQASRNLKNLEYEIIALTTAKKQLKCKITDLEHQLKVCNNKNNVLNDKIRCLQQQKRKIESQVLGLQERIKILECQIQGIDEKCNAEIAVFTNANNDLKDQVDLLSEAIDELGITFDNLVKDNETCQTALLELQIKYDDCKTKLEDLQGDTGCNDKLKELQIELDALKVELEICLASHGSTSDLQSCILDRDAKLREKSDCEEQLQKCLDDKERLTSNLTLCTSDKASVSAQYNECVENTEKCKIIEQERVSCDFIKKRAIKFCNDSVIGVKLENLDTGLYHINTNLKTWFEADDYCGSKGMKLLKLDDNQEKALLYTTLTSIGISAPLWVGYNDLSTPTEFVYSRWGSSPYTFPWRTFPTEPQTGSGQHCASLEVEGGTLVGVNNICNPQTLGCICEMPQPCLDILKAQMNP